MDSSVKLKTNMNNNDPKTSDQQVVSEFRSLIAESDLKCKVLHDEFLLCFIRTRNYNLEKALKLLQNYVKQAQANPQLFTGSWTKRIKPYRRPMSRHFFVSPVRDPNGRLVIIYNTCNWDMDAFSLEESYHGSVLILQRIVADAENQSKGLVLIVDYEDLSLDQIRRVTPSYLKKLGDLSHGKFPVALKALHVINEPFVYKIFLAMLWPFLSNKIRSRCFFHGNRIVDSLHKHVDPACLPSEYEGNLGSMFDTMDFTKVLKSKKYSGIFDDPI